MAGRIDYQIEKFQFIERNESPRITRQWAEVIAECQQEKANSETRLRTALLNVDYATSFELPFRLLLIRAPQLVDRLRHALALNQKSVVINGKKRGCVYSLKADLSAVPEEFRYRFVSRIIRSGPGAVSAAPYQQLAKEIKAPRERLRLALESGLQVNALDGLFWFGIQRIAADISALRSAGMAITTAEVEVADSLTRTTRMIAAYQVATCSR
ncbi:DNA-binding protein [Klebsiella aerogenes]|uniref:helix-turn-helix domain-containing protein n=1 Tax=Klebsiella aerogenes TaxID=548 RepID=UPI00301BDEC8